VVIYQKTRSGTLKMNLLLVTTNILEYCYQVDWNGLCVVKLLRTRSEKAINMINTVWPNLVPETLILVLDCSDSMVAPDCIIFMVLKYGVQTK
jgi:hypothetical protein